MDHHLPEPAPQRLDGLDPERLLGLLDDDLDASMPQIPGWHISGVAGQGGSGIVWRAEREVDGAMAAIKIAPPYEPDTVERIEREAGFLRDLRHPNIVGLLESGPLLAGSDEGGLYMAMEYIDGPALQHQIPEHGLPPQQAYQWFRDIVAAVTYAHDCGILHRDLKPANVLLAPDGRIKVADFGLARPVHRRVHMLSLTRAGQVAGTAEYLPPEAYRRDYQPGPAADIFALGVMLHEMLTGSPPRGAWQPASSRKGVDVRIAGEKRGENRPERVVADHMTRHLREFAEILLGAHPDAQAFTPDGRHLALYAEMVDYRGHGTLRREEIPRHHTSGRTPARDLRIEVLRSIPAWLPDNNWFDLKLDGLEFFDGLSHGGGAGVALIRLHLAGTVTRCGQTDIHREILVREPLWLATERSISPAEAATWAQSLQSAAARAARSPADTAAILEPLFHPVSVEPDAYHLPGQWYQPGIDHAGGITAMLISGGLVLQPGGTRFEETLPGGRSRIAIPVQAGIPRALRADLILVAGSWRAVRLDF